MVAHNFKYSKQNYRFMASLPPFKEKASRVNFCLIRPLLYIVYGLVFGLILFLYGIIIGFTFFINCLTVLCSGKRFRAHYDFVAKLAKSPQLLQIAIPLWTHDEIHDPAWLLYEPGHLVVFADRVPVIRGEAFSIA